jgi:hypothetical protein
MMRGIRRLVVCTAVTGLLAAGAVGASMELAHADTPVTSCDGFQSETNTVYKCTVSTGTATTISDPSAITVGVTDDTSGYTESVVINYTVNCTDSTNGELQTAGAPTEETPVTLNLSLPASADGTCSVSATVSSLSATSGCPASSSGPNPSPSPSPTASVCPDDFSAALSYTAAASPTASATSSAPAVHPVKGFDGKCLDDKGNSSSNRAEVVIWSCSGSDQAENWQYSSNEFKHNGKCLNDQGNGGIRSKVILWSCNGAANEKWSELANGELKLQSHGGSLCLDDPRSSTKNGTQLMVYSCTDSANQKWKLP